jgi:hypothetical protein
MSLDSSVAIDLSFNLFDGLVPVIIPGFSLLDLSHNHFSGEIPININLKFPVVV